MLIAYFHPMLGATSVDTDVQQFSCPKCHKKYGGVLMSGPVVFMECPACRRQAPTNNVDSAANLPQNKPMCMNLHFVTAVAVTVSALRAKGPFSAHNITQEMRRQVNAGELAFTDKPQDPNNPFPYDVSHAEVRAVFRELLDNGVITKLYASPNPAGFLEYQDAAPLSSPVAGQSTLSTAPTLPSKPTSDGVHTMTPVIPSTDDPPLQAYLNNHRSSVISMKRIQSRFKKNFSCREYAALVAGLGYSVNTSGPHPSKWTVQLVKPANP